MSVFDVISAPSIWMMNSETLPQSPGYSALPVSDIPKIYCPLDFYPVWNYRLLQKGVK